MRSNAATPLLIIMLVANFKMRRGLTIENRNMYHSEQICVLDVNKLGSHTTSNLAPGCDKRTFFLSHTSSHDGKFLFPYLAADVFELCSTLLRFVSHVSTNCKLELPCKL